MKSKQTHKVNTTTMAGHNDSIQEPTNKNRVSILYCPLCSIKWTVIYEYFETGLGFRVGNWIPYHFQSTFEQILVITRLGLGFGHDTKLILDWTWSWIPFCNLHNFRFLFCSSKYSWHYLYWYNISNYSHQRQIAATRQQVCFIALTMDMINDCYDDVNSYPLAFVYLYISIVNRLSLELP